MKYSNNNDKNPIKNLLTINLIKCNSSATGIFANIEILLSCGLDAELQDLHILRMILSQNDKISNKSQVFS